MNDTILKLIIGIAVIILLLLVLLIVSNILSAKKSKATIINSTDNTEINSENIEHEEINESEFKKSMEKAKEVKQIREVVETKSTFMIMCESFVTTLAVCLFWIVIHIIFYAIIAFLLAQGGFDTIPSAIRAFMVAFISSLQVGMTGIGIIYTLVRIRDYKNR